MRRAGPDLSGLVEVGRRYTVKVTPGARQATVAVEGEVIRIAVTARAVDGAATEAARDALAGSLGVAKTRLHLERGAASRVKVFRLG